MCATHLALKLSYAVLVVGVQATLLITAQASLPAEKLLHRTFCLRDHVGNSQSAMES